MRGVQAVPTEGEFLLLATSQGAALAVPHRFVDRVLRAALPAAVPGMSGSGYALRVGTSLVPVLFASTLFGGTSVRLRASDWVVLLRGPEQRIALWVDSVEDLESFRAVRDPLTTPWVCAFHDAAPAVPVLDAHALLDVFKE